MQIRIWGARGSIPTPLDSPAIEEKICQAIYGMPALDTQDMAAVRSFVRELPPLVRGTVGGNTTCVEVRAGDQIFIIDAGSGIRPLGLELLKGPCGRGKGTVHLLLSHLHWDHIQGFPFFVPAYIPGNRLIFYSVHDLERALTEQQRAPSFPVPLSYMAAQREFVRLEPGEPFSVGPVRVSTMHNQHPGDSYSFRFEDGRSAFVFASDAEYKALDQASVQPQLDFFRDADALVFDAQYGLRESWESKVDWGHSSTMIGVDLARRAGVRRLILFHHEPTYGDAQLLEIQATGVAYQAQDPSLPACEVLLAYEGLRLDLAPAALEVRLAPDGTTSILTAGSTFDDQAIARRLAEPGPAGAAILDLAQVERLTTTQLKQLVLASRARPDGPPLLAEPSPAVQEVIRLAGYGDYFAIYPTVEVALQAVAAHEALGLPGQLFLGRYQIVTRLSRGQLGTLLWVYDRRLSRDAALRLLPASLTPETLERFGAHIARLRELDLPGVGRTYDYTRAPDGAAILVEELLHGPTLEARLRAQADPLTPTEALTIAIDLTAALEGAHRHGVMHGNVRPRDVFLTPDGLRLSGFALGRLQEGRNLLETPTLFISASHVAPEQILGYPLDARTDLYSLGVTLYQLFTRRLPFAGRGEELLRAHLEQAPASPRSHAPQLSPSVEHLIMKLLAKNPNERYATAQQVRRVLESLRAGEGETATRRRLVGREAPLAALEQAWAEVLAGHGQLAFILGEPGIGKTTLAQQIAARHPAAVVLTGACRPDGGPYHAVRAVLQAYVASVPPELFDAEARPLLAVAAELLPELRQAVPGLEPLPALEPQQARLRLIIGLSQLVARATRARPWCLILDDLQWADEGTLDLLRALGRHAPELPLLLLGTYRDTEVGPDHPLQEALLDLGRAPGLERIALDRLDVAGVGEVLAQLWDEAVPPALVAEIARQTGGNPLYVEEVAKGLAEDGLVEAQGGVWRYPDHAAVRLPQSVYEAVEERIHFLSPETREVLTQAAVFGPTFRFDDLVALSGREEWAVLEQLDLALERQLVVELGGDRELCFRHAEIHQVIYGDLGELRRRHLHRRAGVILERRAGAAPQRMAAELAHHFGRAGETGRERRYLELAGEQAAAQFANVAALDYLGRALALAPADDLAARWRLLHTREQVYDVLGQRAPQLADLRALEALAEALGDPRRRAEVALRWSRYDEAVSDYPAAVQAARRALDLAGDDPALQAAARRLWGSALLRRGDYDGARAQLEAALGLARAAGERQTEREILSGLGLVAYDQGSLQTAVAFYEQALALAQAIAHRPGEAKALNHLGNVATKLGDYLTARTWYEQALRIDREVGDQHHEAMVLANLGRVTSVQGDYASARAVYGQALAVLHAIGDRQSEAIVLKNLGMITSAQGEHEAARAALEQAAALARQIGASLVEVWALMNLGHALLDAAPDDPGAAARAADAFREAIERGGGLGNPVLLAECRAGLARALRAAGDMAGALELVELVLGRLALGNLDGADTPMRAYLCCYEVLRAAGDGRAGPLLEGAHTELMAQAACMGDAYWRMFLEQVPWNRALMAEWEAQLGVDP